VRKASNICSHILIVYYGAAAFTSHFGILPAGSEQKAPKS